MATVALREPASETSRRRPQVRRAADRLRVGLVVDGRMQPRWLVEAFERIARSDYAEVAVLAIGPDAPPLHWAWRAYQRIDGWAFGGADQSQRLEDIASRLPHAHLMSVGAGDQGGTRRAWLTELRLQRLDVLFNFGDVENRMQQAEARYGVWRFQFGGGCANGAMAGAREVADDLPLSAVRLIVQLADGRERVAYQSFSRTVPFSVTRNRRNLLRRTAAMPDRMLRRLRQCGDDWVEEIARAAPAPFQARQPELPALQTARGMASVGVRAARRAMQKLSGVEQWFLGYRFDGGRAWPQAPGGYTCLIPPRDRFWADPFPLQRDGRCCIFFEELPFATGKAHIAMVEIGRDGRCSAPVPVLQRDYHLSYPFLIESDGELFMVPETGDNRSVELYRCVEFPYRWQFEKVLLTGMFCVDASFHRADGLWWMFVNIGSDSADVHDELHLYYAEHLLGEWRPHRANPVKSDVRSARSAGRLFERAGRLYRPAQICAPLYGSGIALNEVLHLNPHVYQERQVARILPPRGTRVLGVHTLNRHGNLSVIDGFLRRPRLGSPGAELLRPEGLRPLYAAEPALVESV